MPGFLMKVNSGLENSYLGSFEKTRLRSRFADENCLYGALSWSWSFQDVALQALPHFMDIVKSRQIKTLILVATSGDTGRRP